MSKPKLRKNQIAALTNLPPEAAVRFLRSRGITVSEHWSDVWEAANAHAACITGELKLDVIQTVFNELTKQVARGGSSTAIAKRIAEILAKKGLYFGKRGGSLSGNPDEAEQAINLWRLKLITKQNISTAYMAGRWQRYHDNKANRPYVQYQAILDESTRENHRALSGRVFHIDDPAVDLIWPPNGFNCRCRMRAYSQADLDARGLKPSNGVITTQSREVINTRTGEVLDKTQYTVAAGGSDVDQITVDLGFAYNAGKHRFAPFTPELHSVNVENSALARRADTNKLLPNDLTDVQYVDAFLAEFNLQPGERKVIKDVTGEAIPISADLLTDRRTGALKVNKRDRGRYLPLLAKALIDPDEVWVNWEQVNIANPDDEPIRDWRLKRYYIRVIDLGNQLYAVGVFSRDRRSWYGATIFNVDGAPDRERILRYINDRRTGKLLYKKNPQSDQ